MKTHLFQKTNLAISYFDSSITNGISSLFGNKDHKLQLCLCHHHSLQSFSYVPHSLLRSDKYYNSPAIWANTAFLLYSVSILDIKSKRRCSIKSMRLLSCPDCLNSDSVYSIIHLFKLSFNSLTQIVSSILFCIISVI